MQQKSKRRSDYEEGRNEARTAIPDFHLYYDGFRTMTLGKTLWAVILIKLAIIFLVLKLFFFPNYINSNAKNGDKADFVSKEILSR